MTVIVLTTCPAGLRGFLTRWLMEISAGVFIGNPSARIREALWREVHAYAGTGRALLAYSTDTEQGFTFETRDHKWRPVDHEGLTLLMRPHRETVTEPQAPTKGWSKASKRRRFGKR
ncbi:type I-E CRISPR-associated endoribonuclease Cas2e [Nocardiopsis composta]|uniref:CRISPR-associated protein Cas2 n=1 Tax=Nocardiopsis composta TaxID=157465 RepID=A0A7W8QID6_9ACTN|nr:type I-E CRISPR-associated endoribonuclease Cas2e [Nocardiopsis composta]MBB5431038.1 CRISPR-associated protein Cas2 [Nocardiopsis composta]